MGSDRKDSKGNASVKRSIFGTIKSALGSKKSGRTNSDPADPDVRPGEQPPTYNDAVSAGGLSPAPAAATASSPSPSTSGAGLLSPLQALRQSSPSPGGAPALSNDSITSLSDPWAFLSTFDTIFLVDDSGSMSGQGRWTEVRTVLNQIVPICTQHDKDGIDLYFLNNATTFENVKDPTAVDSVFSKVFPVAATPTGKRVYDILNPYVLELEKYVRQHGKKVSESGHKPINLIVITDGEPNDSYPYQLPRVLEDIARRLDNISAPSYQIGVQFFQVGRDPTAKRALEQLDDDLGGQVKGGKLRDIVDTCTFDMYDSGSSVLTYDAILKVVLGAVQRKYDAKKIQDQRVGFGSFFGR